MGVASAASQSEGTAATGVSPGGSPKRLVMRPGHRPGTGTPRLDLPDRSGNCGLLGDPCSTAYGDEHDVDVGQVLNDFKAGRALAEPRSSKAPVGCNDSTSPPSRRAGHAATASTATALRAGRDGVLEVRDDRVGSPYRCALQPVSGVAGDVEVAARDHRSASPKAPPRASSLTRAAS